MRTFIVLSLLLAAPSRANATDAGIDSIERPTQRGNMVAADAAYVPMRNSILENLRLKKLLCDDVRALQPDLESRASRHIQTLRGYQWPTEEFYWGPITEAIAPAWDYATSIRTSQLLKDCEIVVENVGALTDLISDLTARIESDAPKQMYDYLNRHDSIQSFFGAYPIELDHDKTIRSLIALVISQPQNEHTVAYTQTLQKLLPYANPTEAGAINRLINGSIASISSADDAPDLLSKLYALSATTDVVDSASNGPIPKIYLINANGDLTTRCSMGGAPANSTRIDANNLIQSLKMEQSKRILIVGCSRGSVTRTVVSDDSVTSNSIVGSSSVENPEYAAISQRISEVSVAIEAQKSRDELNNAVYGTNIIKSIFQGASLSTLEKKKQDLVAQLSRTPPILETPLVKSYQYRRIRSEYSTRRDVSVLLVDHVSNTILSWLQAPIIESVSIDELYGVEPTDSDSNLKLQATNWQGRVSEIQGAAKSIDLAKSLDEIGRIQRPESASLTEARIIQSANNAFVIRSRRSPARTATLSATQQTHDHRLESVVVVKTPTALGSGFFVTPTLVVTNAHVVDGSPYVTLTNVYGQSSDGQVLTLDKHRDLALIRTNLSGRVAILGTDKNVVLGASVDVVGHPKGLTFSLTKGIVSAVRAEPSSLDPGSGPVLDIQTDAAINPGNSGGPMYSNGSVIGVATWKIGGTEGISFAIHVDELATFLKLNGVDMERTK